MGVKRVFKKFLRYLVPTLLVLLIIPVTGRYQSQKASDSFKDKPFKCILGLESYKNYLSKGYLSGFNYELLKAFGNAHSDSTLITLAEKGADYADSLLLDSLSVLVVPPEEIPAVQGITALFPVDSSVAWVFKSNPYKGHEIIRWFNSFKSTPEYPYLVQRFFNCYNPYSSKRNPRIISPYDESIKRNSRVIGWDWRLLAALIWSESMFRIDVTSPRGAVGLMQMMPRTAKRFGVDNVLDPEENITAGAKYLSMLQKLFSAYTDDPEMLMRLTIASYNCGEGRTLEDLDGREQSAETTAYIKSVLNQYDIFRGEEPRYKEVLDSVENTIPMDSTAVTVLLGPDGLGGIDPGDEHAGDEKQQHDDKE